MAPYRVKSASNRVFGRPGGVKFINISSAIVMFNPYPKSKELSDYKFFCFNGVPKYCQVIADRRTKETIDFFDMEWNHQEFYGLNPKCGNAAKPENFEKMKSIAQKLSADIPFTRVDLYNINGKVYFGEITLYPASGLGCFTPDEWNLRLGNLIMLPNAN